MGECTMNEQQPVIKMAFQSIRGEVFNTIQEAKEDTIHHLTNDMRSQIKKLLEMFGVIDGYNIDFISEALANEMVSCQRTRSFFLQVFKALDDVKAYDARYEVESLGFEVQQ